MADKKEFIAYLPEDDLPENDIMEEISQKSGASSTEVRSVLGSLLGAVLPFSTGSMATIVCIGVDWYLPP